MGIEVPSDVRIFSSDFKDLIFEICTEVNRLSQLTADINRVRAIVDRSGGIGDGIEQPPNDVSFFQIASGGSDPVENGDFFVREYNGSVFRVLLENDALVKEVIDDDATGYDLAIVQHDPIQHPATELITDPLESGMIVMCLPADSKWVFTSIMPRLSVIC